MSLAQIHRGTLMTIAQRVSVLDIDFIRIDFRDETDRYADYAADQGAITLEHNGSQYAIAISSDNQVIVGKVESSWNEYEGETVRLTRIERFDSNAPEVIHQIVNQLKQDIPPL